MRKAGERVFQGDVAQRESACFACKRPWVQPPASPAFALPDAPPCWLRGWQSPQQPLEKLWGCLQAQVSWECFLAPTAGGEMPVAISLPCQGTEGCGGTRCPVSMGLRVSLGVSFGGGGSGWVGGGWWVPKRRARPGVEPGTSRTLSENHTPRPTSRGVQVPGHPHPVPGTGVLGGHCCPGTRCPRSRFVGLGPAPSPWGAERG